MTLITCVNVTVKIYDKLLLCFFLFSSSSPDPAAAFFSCFLCCLLFVYFIFFFSILPHFLLFISFLFSSFFSFLPLLLFYLFFLFLHHKFMNDRMDSYLSYKFCEMRFICFSVAMHLVQRNGFLTCLRPEDIISSGDLCISQKQHRQSVGRGRRCSRF